MLYKKIFFLLFLLFAFQVHANADKAHLYLLNIDKVGPTLLDKIKQHQSVEWWIEMGDRMIVATDTKTNPALPGYFHVISGLNDTDVSELALQAFGHCEHGADNQVKHSALTPVFAQGSFQLVKPDKEVMQNQALKDQLFAHHSVFPIQKNSVLAYQYQNRFQVQASAFDPAMDQLLQQVDKNRWFDQVEYLSSLNRQLESDLITAGEWIEQKFENLGLTTSRVSHTLYRGFSIVGFKKGTVRPDDWYVIGGHLDSRNSTWDDSLDSPGAEDNASGCSGVMEVANVFSQYETEASVLFMCFTAEEYGNLGSQLLVADMGQNNTLQNIKAMLNMDMISYRRGDSNRVQGSVLLDEHLFLINQVAENGELYTDLNWQISVESWLTDYLSFAERGVPASTSSIPAPRGYFGYHTTNDLAEHLDADFGASVIKANLATLAQLSGLDLSASSGFSIVPGHSGLWYDAKKPGHGVTIEVLEDNRMLAVWYTYGTDGKPLWLLGVGDYTDTTANLAVTYIDEGAFPPSLIPDNPTIKEWGSFEIEFSDCSTAEFMWSPNADNNVPAGSMSLTQLSRIAGLNCEDGSNAF
ncbi:M28 family metallopeptidase [Marinicella sp. W31]|uniref:M28 family metallopeptidase n=1 Tax=Marinicella sp. W31 TaxID=3023713 RepID=UPI003756482E